MRDDRKTTMRAVIEDILALTIAEQNPARALMQIRTQCAVRLEQIGSGELREITYYTNPIGMRFVLIPPGEFMMGSQKGQPNEKPVHRIMITKPFFMGACQVTQAEWKAYDKTS